MKNPVHLPNLLIESGTVTKLRASSGSVLGSFTVGSGPFGVAFDGPTGVFWDKKISAGSIEKQERAKLRFES
jgi:hypothetical protein